jgi:hypothetical protein
MVSSFHLEMVPLAIEAYNTAAPLKTNGAEYEGINTVSLFSCYMCNRLLMYQSNPS